MGGGRCRTRCVASCDTNYESLGFITRKERRVEARNPMSDPTKCVDMAICVGRCDDAKRRLEISRQRGGSRYLVTQGGGRRAQRQRGTSRMAQRGSFKRSTTPTASTCSDTTTCTSGSIQQPIWEKGRGIILIGTCE
jgi:hypothetical protein